MRVIRWVLLFAILCLATACQRKAGSSLAFGDKVAESGQTRRYLAIRQSIEIETTESELQKAWTAALNFCGTIRCEVVSSAINRAAGSAPSGNISVRVAPDDLPKLLDALGKTGNLVRQSTEAEDKTATVIDVEAKIRNLTEFRDSLRALLGRSNANLRDLIEVRKQLADTQAELDSQTTMRKMLADQTEKIAVDIRFNVQGYGTTFSGAGTIGAALNESLSVLGESVAALITFSFAALPWVLALILVGWLLSKVIRRMRVNK
jgi:hypothetical protein